MAKLKVKWGWFYWLKKYRGDRILDELNQRDPIVTRLRWFMPTNYD